MFKDKRYNTSHPEAPKCGIEHFEGYCIDLAIRIEKLINQKFNICLVPDNLYGGKFDNGTWNGMLGQVVRQVLHLPQSNAIFYLQHFPPDSFVHTIDNICVNFTMFCSYGSPASYEIQEKGTKLRYLHVKIKKAVTILTHFFT